MMQKLRPPLVLLLIAVVVSAALVVTYNLTYVDLSGVLTDEMKEACTDIFGSGEFMLLDTGEEIEGVSSVIERAEGGYAFDITVDGYAKDGLRLMIGIVDDAVAGVRVLAIGETPGLGTKVEGADFLAQFVGKTGTVEVIKSGTPTESQISAVTGATFSSRGVTDAVNLALQTYNERGGNGIE